MAEVGKAATNLKDDVKADVERLKANLGHKADATRILMQILEQGLIQRRNKLMQRVMQKMRGIRLNLYLALIPALSGKRSIKKWADDY